MVTYIKDRIRNEIYAVIASYGNNLIMINAETAKTPWVIINQSDVHPDGSERFSEVPTDYRDHLVEREMAL